jgi:hypothetical protein
MDNWVDDLEMDPLSWLRIHFGNLKHINENHNEWIDTSGSIIIRETNPGLFWINFWVIWSKLEVKFKLNYMETKEILRHWLKTDYNLNVSNVSYKIF